MSHIKLQISKSILSKNAIIFLPSSQNMGSGCPKDPSHLDGSFEYPQHVFWLRNKKIDTSLSGGWDLNETFNTAC